MRWLSCLTTAAAVSLAAFAAYAEEERSTGQALCEYRPSNLLSPEASATVAGTSLVVSGTGTAMTAAGFYTLVHATSGLTMLGSTMAGASGAGTVGIIAGTGGVIGTVAAIVMAPATIITAAVIGTVTVGAEAGCYFLVDERITDFNTIASIMRDLAVNADPKYFQFRVPEFDPYGTTIAVGDGTGENFEIYFVRDLYIVNGVLKNSEWGFDTVIGNVGFVQVEIEQQ